MKKISKNLHLILSLILLLGFIYSNAQGVKPDTIHLTTEEIVNGETVVWDTIIHVTPENEDEINEYLKKKHKGVHVLTTHKGGSNIGVKTYSINGKKFKAYFDTDVKMDVKMDGGTKVLTYTMKGDKHHKQDGRVKIITEKLRRTAEGEDELELVIEAEEGGDYEVVWVGDSSKLHTKHNIWVSSNDDHKKVELVVVGEKDGKFNVRQFKDSLKNVVLEYVHEGSKGEISKSMSYAFVTGDGNSFTIDSLHEHLDIVKEFKFTSEDENVFVVTDGGIEKEIKVKVHGDLKNLKEKIYVTTTGDKMKNMVFYGDGKVEESIEMELNIDVSDEELEELGIKTKPNELKAKDFWMFYDDEKGLKLKFTLETEGKTTIKIIDAEGESLYTDKVVYFPGTYNKKIKLGENYAAPIFIYIEQGNASTIKKLNLN